MVVTGAWTTLKEQMPKTYAIEMAKKGFAALTFDFRGWGESSGKNRFLESPERKTQDIVEAVSFLSSRPEINKNKIAGLGVCASSGYMADAYTRTKKLKTVALVAPWLHNKDIATQVYGGEKSVQGLLKTSDEAQGHFKKTGRVKTVTAASTTDKNSVMFNAPYYTEKKRGLIKEYDNKFNLASWRGWLTYDAMKSAQQLPGEILFVGSEKMALPQGAKAYAKIAGKKVKQVWLKNATQFDFYDDPKFVKQATESVVKHFSKK
ncbi:MAG: alpha/beta hydrolase [Bdellovibrionales bacterium]|nr:alpha/beta hydrolase [Bdellovibrionales bacterium]